MQEIQVRALSREDALEKEMATDFSILAWRILWTEAPSGLWSEGPKRVGHSWSDLARMHAHTPGIFGCHTWRMEKGRVLLAVVSGGQECSSVLHGAQNIPGGTKNNLASNVNDVTCPRIVPTPFCHDWHVEETGTVVLQHTPLSAVS